MRQYHIRNAQPKGSKSFVLWHSFYHACELMSHFGGLFLWASSCPRFENVTVLITMTQNLRKICQFIPKRDWSPSFVSNSTHFRHSLYVNHTLTCKENYRIFLSLVRTELNDSLLITSLASFCFSLKWHIHALHQHLRFRPNSYCSLDGTCH